MIKPLLIAAMIAAPIAHADAKIELCEEIGNTAVRVFDARQGNVSFDMIIPVVRGVIVYKDQDIGMQIAHGAYTSPRWYTDERRETKRVDFKSKWVLWCHGTDKGEW